MVLDPEPETTPEPFQRPEPAGADVRARFMTGGGYCLLASANFGGLVLGCIEADFCVQILILQYFSRSTRFTLLRTAPYSKFAVF